MPKTCASQTAARIRALTGIPYSAAAIDVALAEIVAAVAGSGFPGSHARCKRLLAIRKEIRSAVVEIDLQTTALIAGHEAERRAACA